MIMKIVKLNPTNSRHPEAQPKDLVAVSKGLADSHPSNGHPAINNQTLRAAQSDGPLLDPWQYQGKRRDQVEGSYKIFVLCLVASVVILLASVIVTIICQ